jgi:thiosulfate dehydrogenase [quinone] large subunit
MKATLTIRERIVRVALGLAAFGIAINVGLTGHGSTEPIVLAWGALAVSVFALMTAAMGSSGALARVGLDDDWSLEYLAARLFVGWEFLYAGWEKATNGWYTHSAGTAEVKGILTGAMAQSHATAQNPFPAVSHWFGWTADNVLVQNAHLISYLVVTGELLVGIGLILGLFLKASAFFGVTLNVLFMSAGALGAGLNPEMVIPGMIVLLGVAPAVYALSVDRYLLPWLREELHHAPHLRHATAH